MVGDGYLRKDPEFRLKTRKLCELKQGIRLNQSLIVRLLCRDTLKSLIECFREKTNVWCVEMQKRSNNSDICFIRPVEKGNAYWQKAIRGYGFKTEIPYKDNNLFMRIAREIWFRLGLSKKVWFNKKIDEVNSNIIIVKDILICKEYIEWLRKRKPNARIILDYDNRVSNSIDPDSIIISDIEKWTYDPDDASQYNMRLKEPSYMDCFKISDDKRRGKKKYDIVYVGRDKGRADYLLSLENEFRAVGLRTYFHISPTHRYQLAFRKYYRPVIRYEEYLGLINHSKAILNIMRNNQKALTMRDFEAIFNGIKCITNNKAIKEFEAYDESRFFVLGEDNMKNLSDFIKSDFEPVAEEMLERYGFCNSLKIMLSS